MDPSGSPLGHRTQRRWLLALGAGVTFALALGAWLAVEQGQPKPAGAPKQRSATQVWRQITKKSRQESRPRNLRSWPFAAIVRPLHPMRATLRKEAKEVLGNPAHLGLRFGSARHVVAPNGVGLWVVSGRSVTCMFRAVNIAGTCSPTAEAYRHGLLLELYKLDKGHGRRPTTFTVFGIAPDGVRSVAGQAGGQPIEIPVVHNAFSATASGPINVISPSG